MLMVKDFEFLRNKMVDDQLCQRGITDTRVIEAMRKIPRHEFIPIESDQQAYDDAPVSIGENQTISQPYMVALMTEILRLEGQERVLEIGTGSGYQTAVLAQICREVYSIERLEILARAAACRLERLGYHNIKIRVGDGTLGWSEAGAFDAIMITAAAPEITYYLAGQLNINGRMAVPVGDRFQQKLMLLTRQENRLDTQEICSCVFVPLIGKFGWKNTN